MKVIDLLNKIAKGEEVPKEIMYENISYYWCKSCEIYEREENATRNLYNDIDNLNDEIEIIEEPKKIKKLETYKTTDGENYYANILKVSKNGEYEITEDISVIVDKLNELIDYINDKENK